MVPAPAAAKENPVPNALRPLSTSMLAMEPPKVNSTDAKTTRSARPGHHIYVEEGVREQQAQVLLAWALE
jgi:hypothetical protein